ncbi:zinc ribbon domain-containing protein [Candidatus Bathyarchaeota archaeon]|nr:zinc ribbon domain-containing protein [Candidatus Bathyarchaeota archaeon]
MVISFFLLTITSATVQLNFQLVKAQPQVRLDSVDVSPRIVNNRQTFTVTVHGIYHATGRLDLTVVILNIDNEQVGGPSHHTVQREDPSIVEGEWQLTLTVNPPTRNEVLGHGIEQDPENRHLSRRILWASIQETGQRLSFYSLISDMTELYVDIVDAYWVPAEGEGESVNPLDDILVHIKYEVCPRLMPRREPPTILPCYIKIQVGSSYTIAPLEPMEWFRLGDDYFPRQWEHRRGAVYRAVSDEIDIRIKAPDAERSYDLDLVFYVYAEEENVEGCRVQSDSVNFNIPVLYIDVNNAWIERVSVEPEEVEPGQSINVNVAGGYRVVEAGGIPIAVNLRVDDEHEYSHDLGYVQNSGLFNEEFQIPASSEEGVMHLVALVCRMDTIHIFDQKEASVTVGSRTEAQHYCRITSVLILPLQGVEPIQQVTPGQDFRIHVEFEWNLARQGRFYVKILDISGINRDSVIADGYIYYSREQSDSIPGVFSCTVEGFRIPPRSFLPADGRWTLRAEVYYQYGSGEVYESLSHGDSREFNILVGEGGSIPSGASDWSITDVLTSPVEPFLGVGVTFIARIRLTTHDPLPQIVGVSYSIDGGERLRGMVTFEEGMSFLAVSSPYWMPTLGQHTIKWEVDPDHNYNDPNRENNVRELRFIVAEAPRLPKGYQIDEHQAEEEFDYYVTAIPTEQIAHNLATYNITVNIVSGVPEPIQLELIGVPIGVSYYFDPPSGIPRYTSTLTLTVAKNLPVGLYSMVIKASGGGKERYKPITLIIEQGPDYALSINPNSIRAKPGEKVKFTVTAESNTGYSKIINLMALGVPKGVEWRFEPQASTPNFQSNLILELNKNVTPGAYTIVISDSGVKDKRVPVTLWVEGSYIKSSVEKTIDYLAAIFLALILAAIFSSGFFAFKRIKAKRAKAFCVECGAKLASGVDYCPKCGAKQPKLEEKS